MSAYMLVMSATQW